MDVNIALPPLRGQLRRPMRSWPEFLMRFLHLAGPYWSDEARWKVRGLTAVLVVLTVAQVAVPVALNSWTEDLFDALSRKSMSRFLFLLGILLVIIVSNVAIVTTHLRIKRRLQVGWRDWLTRRITGEWMEAGRQYQVTHTPGEHDNPDGRIAEDIRITTEYAIDLAHSLLYSTLLLASFAEILWTLSGLLEIRLGGFTLSIPGHLVGAAFLYAAVGASVAFLLGRPLVRATDRRQTFEANFRFGLVRARENSLAIALVRGEADERRRFRDLFRGAVEAWDRQTAALVNIFFYISSWSVLSQVFPILIAAPRYISGTITLGVLMQTAQAVQQMIAALSWPIDNLSKLADWRASVERVLGLHDAVGRLAAHLPPTARSTIAFVETGRPALVFADLSITGPDGAPLIAGFSTEIRQGEHVLLTGEPDAADKLFKAAAGLWPWGGGRIERPHGADIFFMPQRPYLPIGPLRAAVSYPDAPERYDDAAIRAALDRVGLGHLASRIDETEIWEQVLATGDQQRLGFARLLLHRPRWLFVQEATDALDPQGEEDMMGLLQEEFAGATVLVIGHHPVLAAYHRRKLVLSKRNGVTILEEVPAR
jgi:putative ATP-binding cassette transporter